MQTNNSGLIVTTSENEIESSTSAPVAGPAFFKHDFSDLTSNTYIQVVGSTLSAAEILENLSKTEDDDEYVSFVSIIVSHFIEAYAKGHGGTAGRRREPTYCETVKFILTPNRENEMAPGSKLFYWVYSYFFAFANLLEQIGRVRSPSLETARDFLISTAAKDKVIFEKLTDFIQTFPGNIPPAIYGALFGVLLREQSEERMPNSGSIRQRRQAVENICAFIKEILLETEIDGGREALMEFSDPALLERLKPDWMDGKDPRRILRAAYAYAELQKTKNCYYYWYPENLIEFLIKAESQAIGTQLEDPEFATPARIELAIAADCYLYDIALCKNDATGDEVREKIFRRSLERARQEHSGYRNVWRMLASSNTLTEKMMPALADHEAAEAFTYRMGKLFSSYKSEENEKFTDIPGFEELFVRTMRAIRDGRNGTNILFVSSCLSEFGELSPEFISPKIVEDALWQFRGLPSSMDEKLAKLSWSGEKRNAYFANHQSIHVVSTYCRSSKTITETLFKQALYDRQRRDCLVQNPLWLDYLSCYVGGEPPPDLNARS